MLGRFFYHGFWNFYDRLGTLVLLGTAYALAVLGITVLAFANPLGLVPVVAFAVSGLLIIVITALCASGLGYHCWRTANGFSATVADIKRGMGLHWKRMLLILLLWALAEVILLVNLQFYKALAAQATGGVSQVASFVGITVAGWLVVMLLYLLPPTVAAVTGSAERQGLKATLKRGIMVGILTPGPWVTTGVVLVALFVSGFFLRLPWIFVLPVLCSLGQTAMVLALQQVGFLQQATDELGAGQSIGAYKAKARQLTLEWEARQPRRTLKELIKPWEY